MKRIIRAILVFTLMLVCLEPARAASAEVRVLLSVGEINTLTMSVKGSFIVPGADEPVTSGKLTFSIEEGALVLTHSRLGELYRGSGPVRIDRAVSDVSGGFLTFTVDGFTRSFLGRFTVSINNGFLRVVNTVPLRHYLYGVVGYEMSNSFPVEALKAQAIAAKNYVLSRMNGAGEWDVKDTAADQVYKGYVKTLRNVIKAVDDTIDIALYLNGEIMPCWYSASNGGYSVLPSENWGNTAYDAGYQKGADPFDLRNTACRTESLYIPRNLARRSFSGTELYDFFMQKAEAALNKETLPKGWLFDGWEEIVNLVSTAADGKLTQDGDHARIECAIAYRIREEKRPLTPGPGSSAAPEGPGRAGQAKERRALTFSFTFAELKEAGLFTDTGIRITYVRRAEKGFTLFHGRYGHGAGMSQRGAQQMAKEGWTFDRILDFYYPGAEVRSIEVPIDQAGDSALTELDVSVFGKAALRTSSSFDAQTICPLKEGQKLTLLRTDGTFYYVRVMSTGREGYLVYNNIAIDGAPIRCTATVTGSGVNVRSGPGTKWDSVAKLDFEDTVSVLDTEADFYRVYAGGGLVGYVSSGYLRLKPAAAEPERLTVAAVTPQPTLAPGVTPTPVPIEMNAPDATPEPLPDKQGDGRYLAIGVIDADATALLSGPTALSDTLLTLKKGAECGIYGKTGPYYHVQDLDTAREGWIHAAGVNVLRSGTHGAYEQLFLCEADGDGLKLTKDKKPGSAVAAKLEDGEILRVITANGLWYEAETAEKLTGWIYIGNVAMEDRSGIGETQTARADAEPLSVYSRAHVSKKAAAKLEKGERFVVFAVKNGWAEIRTEKLLGWCRFEEILMD